MMWWCIQHLTKTTITQETTMLQPQPQLQPQHAIGWFEIPSSQFSRAVKFYNTMLATELKVEKFGPAQNEMAVFTRSGPNDVSGCIIAGADYVPHHQGTLVYLNCGANLEGALSRTESAGGQVMLGKTALPPGMGYFAHILDTEGNRIGLHGLS